MSELRSEVPSGSAPPPPAAVAMSQSPAAPPRSLGKLPNFLMGAVALGYGAYALQAGNKELAGVALTFFSALWLRSGRAGDQGSRWDLVRNLVLSALCAGFGIYALQRGQQALAMGALAVLTAVWNPSGRAVPGEMPPLDGGAAPPAAAIAPGALPGQAVLPVLLVLLSIGSGYSGCSVDVAAPPRPRSPAPATVPLNASVVQFTPQGSLSCAPNQTCLWSPSPGLLDATANGVTQRLLTPDALPLPLPVTGSVAIQGMAGGVPVPVSGNITANSAAVGTTGAAIPTSAELLGASDGTNLQQLLCESATNRNLRVGLYSGANEATVTAASALKVDGSAVTQPVSGPVTANAGTNLNTSALALESGGNLAQIKTNTATTAAGSSAAVGLPVQGMTGGVPIPVSGTVTANAGTGTFNSAAVGTTGAAIPTSAELLGASDGTNLQQLLCESATNRNLRVGLYSGANEATVTAANALKVDGSAVTQPVSAATLPLPAGAAADSSVNGLLVSQASTTSGEKGPLCQGAVTTSPPSYATAQTNPLSLDTAGNLRTAILALPSILGAVYLLDSGGTNKGAINSVGQQYVNTEGQKATYSVSIAAFAAAASPTDVFGFSGSSTKTIRITRVQISGTATSTTAFAAQLVRRSASDSGGTSTQPTIASHDSNNASATAVAAYYTANPTGLGASAGVVRAKEGVLSTTAPVPIEWEFSTRNGQGLVLRGTSQLVYLYLGGATLTGASLNVDVEWTEE